MDLIDRQAAISYAVSGRTREFESEKWIRVSEVRASLQTMPSAQPEQLTDKEQRIFLAAMDREEEVCKEVDRKYVREPYEDSLVRICHEIIRKVKGALWT